MTDNLLLRYGLGGGAPPAPIEFLRVFEAGLVELLTGCALHDEHAHTIGRYQVQLSDPELEILKRLVHACQALPVESAGPRYPGSMVASLVLFTERGEWRFELSNNEGVAEPTRVLLAYIGELAARLRSHPVQCIALTAQAGHMRDDAVSSLALKVQISNPGTEKISLRLIDDILSGPSPVRLHIPDGKSATDDLFTSYNKSRPVLTDPFPVTPVEVAPGETVSLTLSHPAPGASEPLPSLHLFLGCKITVSYNDAPLTLDRCVIGTIIKDSSS